MKKPLLILMLAVVSSSAMAEWVWVTGSFEEATMIYANPATIRKKGNIVKLWTLTDYKVAKRLSDKKYMSSKEQYQYDCKEERSRLLTVTAFSKNMGKGEVVGTGGPTEWDSVMPDSLDEASWKFACGK